jgi:hypothetical protein
MSSTDPITRALLVHPWFLGTASFYRAAGSNDVTGYMQTILVESSLSLECAQTGAVADLLFSWRRARPRARP